MLARSIIFAICVTLAAAAPNLHGRTNPPTGYHYNVGSIATACPGVTIPANGIYAAVSVDAGVAAPCGRTLSITDSSTSQTVTGVLVVGTFVNCDSAACSSNAVRVSDAAGAAVGFPSSFLSFPAVWSFT